MPYVAILYHTAKKQRVQQKLVYLQNALLASGTQFHYRCREHFRFATQFHHDTKLDLSTSKLALSKCICIKLSCNWDMRGLGDWKFRFWRRRSRVVVDLYSINRVHIFRTSNTTAGVIADSLRILTIWHIRMRKMLGWCVNRRRRLQR